MAERSGRYMAVAPGAIALLALCRAAAQGTDWPQWGRDATRNMVSPDRGLPERIAPGRLVPGTDRIDTKSAVGLRWLAKLGSQAYGNPTASGGRVFVGTNNQSPRDPRLRGDRSCVYCLDAGSGELVWQLAVPKLGTGKVSDWEYLGICSSPAVDGDRVYVVTNRCEVVCLDVEGLANGNDGPFTAEGQYLAGPGQEPLALAGTDADIVWATSMIDECGVFPHNITSCSVLVAGDRLYTATSNGVDYGHVDIPAPNAPCLIALDKRTGAIVAEEASGLGRRILHSNWSSPAWLHGEERDTLLYGGPDGCVYAFDEEPVQAGGRPVLRELWRFDCNPREYRFASDGAPIRYATPKGPSEVLGTPVVFAQRVYATIGQDPEHGEGAGNLSCIDREGKEVWQYRKIRRSMCTPAIADGLLLVADYSGFIYCLDAATGAEHWVHDAMAHIWGSPLIADGRVWIGTEDGTLLVLPAAKDYRRDRVVEVDFGRPIYSTPIVAQGVLYVATQTHLFAFARAGK